LEPTEGKIVIAAIDGDLTVKRLERIKGKLYLIAENANYAPIPIEPESDFQIWGTVTYVIHNPN
jgi:DNA polymerase V